MKTTIELNNEQRLYVIPISKGYTCLGYDVTERKINALTSELGIKNEGYTPGTIEHYTYYESLVEFVRQMNLKSGFRSKSELNPKLIGLEGKRIEAIVYGEKRRFKVGRSTGFIPCHLSIHNSRSLGGEALPSDPDRIKDIKIIR